MLHSLSRALHEEVQFDTEKVTSVDWTSRPTLTHADAPEKIDVVLVNGDPEPESPGPAALRRGRDDLQADARGGRQRHLRRDRRAAAAGAVQGRTRSGRAESQHLE